MLTDEDLSAIAERPRTAESAISRELAAARTDIMVLLAEVRRMRAEREHAAACLRRWQGQAGPGHPLGADVDAALAALTEEAS